MAHRSQRSSLEDNPLDPNYLPPHYREEYRLAIDALVEHDVEGYYDFLQSTGGADFLSQPEVEYIKNTLRAPQDTCQPELPYYGPDADGSSDTYWPVHSDLEAPVLDLGWPIHQGFIGPTEVTILINPSDPEMPSIKEQARRLIRNARQVIAVAMDMFTDVDIFAELLDAVTRRVAVYILLEEQNAHHFAAMVDSCRVSLDKVQLMRVRTVSGSTYYCRSGKSFKGQMMDRFLLVDCRAVLCGNYSFMWTFEKIHRCIAHLFLGELVIPFDEEFRILYAQSEPLVMENALALVAGESQYGIKEFSSGRPPSFRSTKEYVHIESSHFPEVPVHPVEDRMHMKSHIPPFQRSELFRGHSEPDVLQLYSNKYASQQLRMDRSFVEHDRPTMISRQIDMNAYKRHSYAEEKHEAYPFSQQMVKHHVKYYPEEVQSLGGHQREQHYYYKGGGPGSGHAMYDKVQACGYHQADDYEYQPNLEPPGSYSYPLDYLSSGSSKETRHSYGPKLAPGEVRYGRSSTKRPSLGQSYPCQSSPTQPHAPDQKQFFTKSNLDRQSQDPCMKQGLRKWRISSYLSTMENAGDEGIPEPLGPDAFEEPPYQSEEDLYAPDASIFSGGDYCPQVPTVKPDLQVPRVKPDLQVSRVKPDLQVHTKKPDLQIPTIKFDQHVPTTKPDLQYGKPAVPKMSDVTPEHQPSLGEDAQILAGIPAEMTAAVITSGSLPTTGGGDRTVEVELRKPREIGKQESFRNRPNLPLLRSSRLRSSLIFSSSQLEQLSAEMKPLQENPVEQKEGDPMKTSSVIAEMLEKRRCIPREPFKWSTLKQQPVQNVPSVIMPESNAPTSVKKTEHSEASTESYPENQELSDSTRVSENKEMPKNAAEEQGVGQVKAASQEETVRKTTGDPPKSLCRTTSFIDMNDPESRFLYFKELAAERKALQKAAESDMKNQGSLITKTDPYKAPVKSSSELQVKCKTTGISGNHTAETYSIQMQLQEPSKVAEEMIAKTVEPPKSSPTTTSFVNMNDPETRFLYFKELAAKRKASKTASQSDIKNPEPVVTAIDTFKTLPEDSSKIQEKSYGTHISDSCDMPKHSAHVKLEEQSKVALEETSKTTTLLEPQNPALGTTSVINMNDPAIRFKYFKELAAKQKVSKMASQQEPKNPELALSKPDASKFPPDSVKEVLVKSEIMSTSENNERPIDCAQVKQNEQSKVTQEETPKIQDVEPPKPTPRTNSSINMNDPESRFMHFKESAAKQKSSKTSHPEYKNSEHAITKSDTCSTLPEGSSKVPEKSETTNISGDHEMQKDTGHMLQTEQSDVADEETAKTMSEELPKPTPSTNLCNLNMNDPETRFMYFKELAANQKASKTAPVHESKIPEIVRNTDVSETPSEGLHAQPAESASYAEPTIRISEGSQDPSVNTSEKPTISAEQNSRMPAISAEPVERTQEVKVDSSDHDHQEKESQSTSQEEHNYVSEKKTLPKEAKKESTLNEDTLSPSLTTSTPLCILPGGEELKDATDAEKSELKKSRSQSTSGMVLDESDKALYQSPETSSSLNTVKLSGDGKQNVEVHEYLKETQELLHTESDGTSIADDILSAQNKLSTPAGSDQDGKGTMISSTPKNVTGPTDSKGEIVDHSPLPGIAAKTSTSRYQASTANVLSSSNLKDDTKVILEQISANSQSRMELAKQAITDDAKGGDRELMADKATEKVMVGRSTGHFHRASSNPQERETLLKRIENMRKEKKVYSRFEVLHNNEKLGSVSGKYNPIKDIK